MLYLILLLTPPVDHAPHPFTAEQIRKASPVGHAWTHQVTEGDKPTYVRRMTVTAADDAKVTIENTRLDSAGKPTGDPQKGDTTWDELMKHATFPAAKTKITDAEVKVPAGTFKVRRYIVTDGDTVQTFDFAPTRPGPPVRFHMSKAGKQTFLLVLLP